MPRYQALPWQVRRAMKPWIRGRQGRLVRTPMNVRRSAASAYLRYRLARAMNRRNRFYLYRARRYAAGAA